MRTLEMLIERYPRIMGAILGVAMHPVLSTVILGR